MKIGIINYPTFGGSGIVSTELGLRLMKKGHEVHFVSYKIPERLKLEEEFIFHEVDILSYPLFQYKPYTILLASKLHNLVKEEKLDILHAHYAIPHATSLHLAKLSTTDVKIITTLHGSDMHLLGLDKSYKPILETSLNAHDGLTTVSYWMKEFILKNYNISTDINVIYNFVDTEKFSVKPKKKYKDKVVFCHVSNFREVKRSPDIVKAFAKVAKKHENIRLEMIGSGPELGYCRDLTISHGLQDKIIFHGSLLNVPEILCHTDVFIIPSARESFGLAALEAMACEIPVISSNAGGLPEVIEDGNAGFQVEPGNIQQLVKYISLLVEDDKLRVKLAKEARKIATTKFHPDKIIPQYENLYREILEKK